MAQSDCAGIPNGSALEDDYVIVNKPIYNFITHSVTFITGTEGVETGPNETIVITIVLRILIESNHADVPGYAHMTSYVLIV